MRNINIQGRAIVIQSLLLSKLWYMLNVQPIPDKVLTSIQEACIAFLWKGSHLVKYNTIIGRKLEGGLNIPDIKLKMKAFRMKMLNRLFNNERQMTWMYVFKFFLNEYKGLNIGTSVLFMKLTAHDVSFMPPVHRQMIMAWYAIRNCSDVIVSAWDMIVNQPLFHNPKITLADHPLRCVEYEQAGVVLIKDILYEFVPGFLPAIAVSELVQDKIDVDIIKIEKMYNILLQAIPHEWICVIEHGKPEHEDTSFCIKTDNLTIAFGGLKSKIFYDLFRQSQFEIPTSAAFWDNYFTEIEQINMWPLVYLPLKPPELIDLDFRITHNCIFTMVKLLRIGKTDNNVCPVCKSQPETMFHLFLDCSELSELTSVLMDMLETLFQNLSQQQLNEINLNLARLVGVDKSFKSVNILFVNLLLSIYRYCVYIRRQIAMKYDKIIPMLAYFKKKCRVIILQIYTYNREHEREDKNMKLLMNNTLLKVGNDNTLHITF